VKPGAGSSGPLFFLSMILTKILDMTDTLDSELSAQVRRNIYAFFSEFFGNGRSAGLLAFWPDIYRAATGAEDAPAPLEASNALEAAYAKLF